MLLAIDVETTGLFRYGDGARADDEDQPRMCALAAILVKEVDEEGNIVDAEIHDFLVRPDGWVVQAEAQAINGLSQERLEAEGVPIADVLATLNDLMDRATVITGYNVNFDLKMTRAEFRRAGLPDRYGDVPKCCMMWGAKLALKVRSIKLVDAVEQLLDRTHDGAHTAMADCRAAVDLYYALHRRGQLPEPKRDVPKDMGEAA